MATFTLTHTTGVTALMGWDHVQTHVSGSINSGNCDRGRLFVWQHLPVPKPSESGIARPMAASEMLDVKL